MTYRIELTRAAERGLKSLPKRDLSRVDARILSLATDPRPQGVKCLKVEERLYRIRVGDYRVVYQVNDDVLLIVVVTIGHRKEVYRRLR